jgi:hypothetical protein
MVVKRLCQWKQNCCRSPGTLVGLFYVQPLSYAPFFTL